MSVEITFEPDHLTGLIAEGSSLLNAAHRMGITLVDECGGRGECDSCAVTIVRGAELLSPATEAELKHLSLDRRAAGERLACQAIVERTGELVLRIAPEVEQAEENTERFRREFAKQNLTRKMAVIMEFEKAIVTRKPIPETGDDVEVQYRREFNEQPLAGKIRTLAELEGAAAIHGVVEAVNLPFTIGEKVMDVMAVRGRKMDEADKSGPAPGASKAE
jgi:ferredoxin